MMSRSCVKIYVPWNFAIVRASDVLTVIIERRQMAVALTVTATCQLYAVQAILVCYLSLTSVLFQSLICEFARSIVTKF